MAETGITLTETAAARVREFMTSDGGRGLRLSVRRTGCSGWAYDVSLDDAARDDDRIFEDRGIRVFVDPKSLPIVQGTRIDFVAEGLNRTFRFTNPNVTGECGCGESFTTT